MPERAATTVINRAFPCLISRLLLLRELKHVVHPINNLYFLYSTLIVHLIPIALKAKVLIDYPCPSRTELILKLHPPPIFFCLLLDEVLRHYYCRNRALAVSSIRSTVSQR